jgi:hypothetical protein
VPLKLYIGCAATGTLQLSVLSKAQTASAMAIKTVAKPIKALSACPASTCNPSSSPAPAASPAPSPAPAGSTTIKLTGNPAVDMMTMWGMFASGMNTSGFMNMPFLPGMDFNTVLTIISGAWCGRGGALLAQRMNARMRCCMRAASPASNTHCPRHHA